jgi:hypothetical protein
MRETVMLLAVALFLLGPSRNLQAASLAGVNLPDSAEVGGKLLVLNGLGLRSESMVKVYVAGLYLEQKSSDPSVIIEGKGPKQLVIQFLHDASKKQMAIAFAESFSENAPDAEATMKGDIYRFLGELEPVKAGDQMVFTYDPAMGATLSINGKEKLTVAGQAFSQVLFSVWLGPKPPTANLKKGILGHQS